jgi:hypothetical protein
MEERMRAPSGNHLSRPDHMTSRRQFLVTTAGVVAAVSLPIATFAAETETVSPRNNQYNQGSAIRQTRQNATLKIYKGASHGLCPTMKDHVNADLLAFIKNQ